jgi:hypothetical protein
VQLQPAVLLALKNPYFTSWSSPRTGRSPANTMMNRLLQAIYILELGLMDRKNKRI